MAIRKRNHGKKHQSFRLASKTSDVVDQIAFRTTWSKSKAINFLTQCGYAALHDQHPVIRKAKQILEQARAAKNAKAKAAPAIAAANRAARQATALIA